jgi:DNA-binding transcriptional regulator LsrR (DeoR family)
MRGHGMVLDTGSGGPGRGPEPEHLRLLAKVARMYHERGMGQPQIAQELSISQPRVSRLLKQAVDSGIVTTVVSLPPGVYTELEEELQRRYGLTEAVVFDGGGASGELITALGAAAATYLNTTLKGGDEIGVSTWSATLLAAVNAMRPKVRTSARRVVQLFGGVGNPEVQFHATRLTSRLADLTGATPVFVPTPGVVSTPSVRRAIEEDASVHEVMALWNRLDLAVVGIGSLTPSALLRQSGNALGQQEQEELRALGAVGDVCLRFFDAAGQLVSSSFDERVVGITPAQLRNIGRTVGVAGGESKYTAIRAALRGGWINVLITDLDVATRLADEPGPPGQT